MSGLMKRAARLAYCGSSKTMGAVYGLRAWLLLNHDMVFLGELLMQKSGQPGASILQLHDAEGASLGCPIPLER
jgi:hypothetical protein